MKNEILIFWITTTIWTIIPNIILMHKIYTKKIEDVEDAGFVHFFCLLLFIIASVFLSVVLVAKFF